MATIKFKTESPFVKINERQHHDSDWKHVNYLQGLSSMTTDDKATSGHCQIISLALVGLGRAGMIHLANILANRRIQLKYIVEGDQDKWTSVKQRWNLRGITFVLPENVKQVYEDPEVDACLVATPTFTHEGYIAASLEAGKAVFTEKPVAETPEAVNRVYEISERMNKPLFCAFNRRYDPSFHDIYRRVRDGQLGQVQQIKLTSRDSPLPSVAYLKISGGIFHDCVVHDIDLMTYILGEYPTEVFSIANAQIPEIAELQDFDNVAVTMQFKSGCIGIVDVSRFASYGYDQRLEVFGPGGMLQVENDSPNTSAHFTSSCVSRVPVYWSFPSRHAHGYVNELEHFINVVLGREKISVTDRMTKAVTKIADACERSARSGKPVHLTWKADEIPEGYIMDC